MPIITISRMYGSGGSEIAQRVADALGWALLDNDIIDRVAERLGVTPAEVQAREERVPSLVERLAEALTLGSGEYMAVVPTAAALPPEDERLLAVTERVIREAAALGPVVLVGRGAQGVLASREDAFHVFCYAPRGALAARVAKRLGISVEDAEREVDLTNRRREQYVKRHWRRDWRAVDNYHLCVNTGWLATEAAADLITRAARDHFGE
jgi:cytidylate kinase